MKKWIPILVVTLLAGILAAPRAISAFQTPIALSTDFYPPGYTVDSGTSAAESVVVGIVREVGPARWNVPPAEIPPEDPVKIARGNAMIIRPIMIETEQTIKGDSGLKIIPSYIFGGELGRIKWTVSGQPQLTTGERVLVFLEKPTDIGDGVTRYRPIAVYHFASDGTASDVENGHRFRQAELIEMAIRAATP